MAIAAISSAHETPLACLSAHCSEAVNQLPSATAARRCTTDFPSSSSWRTTPPLRAARP
jgi:hypothetical protein